MSRREQIQSAYKTIGKEANFYDGMITCSTFLGRLICALVWNMNEKTNGNYIEKVLSAIPEDFCGSLLKVPVGTGILTMPLYKTLPHAQITCLDYSADMMAAAQSRTKQLDIKNISFKQGDVGFLPFENESFDMVLSLNGFHAFPDKQAAYRETHRVLKKGGIFCGCFYIKGENRRTDWFIDHLYTLKGYFTPPYETAESLKARLNSLYSEVKLETVESMACFCCVK